MENVKENNEAKEKLEELSKTYGLSLSQITVVNIEGKEYLKFYDPKEDTIKMIHNGNQNLNEYFNELQNNLSFAKTGNELENARSIFEHEEKYVRESVRLIPISDLINNFNSMTTYLSPNQINKLMFLLKYATTLQIQYIDIKEGICINNNHEVLYPTYNPQDGKYMIKQAEEKKYEDEKMQVDINVEIDGIDFDLLVENFEINVPSDEPIIVSGEQIKVEELNNYINYPELLEKQVNDNQISRKRHIILQHLISAINRKLAKKEKTNQKRLVLKLPNESAYINYLLLFVIAGGLALALILYII